MAQLEMVRAKQRSLAGRLWDTVRSYTLGPLSLKDPEIAKYFSGMTTTTGVPVSSYTALNYSAVWSAVRLISSDVAGLPLVLYKREGERKRRYEEHPLYRILHDSPNPEMSSFTLRQTLQAHALTWGNGYAEIERDQANRPRYLWPITPDRVMPYRQSGQLLYRVVNDNGTEVILSPADMIHVPGLGFDGCQGYDVVSMARESIALGIAAERFGGTFYGNGSTFGGVISHPTRFASSAARNNFEESLRKRHKGVDRAHGLLLLEEGMSYVQIGIPPDAAQFLESRQFQITEIARWFNVPPHKIGDLSRSTNNNIEQQTIDYYQSTLIHWLKSWEQELMRKLISPLERNQQFIEHIVEGILRGDSQGRSLLQSAEFQIGALTPNEARALSNRDPVDGGDMAFIPLNNMWPLNRIGEWVEAELDLKRAEAESKRRPPTTTDDADRTALRTAVTALETALDAMRAEKEQEAAARRAAEQRAEDLSQALGHRDDDVAGMRLELTQALEHLDGARTSLAAEQAERSREKTAADSALNAAVEKAATTEREYQDLWKSQKENINELLRQQDEIADARNKAESERDAKIAEVAGLVAEVSGAKQALETAQAERAEAISHRHAAQANESLSLQRAEQAERDKAIAEQAQAAANATITALTEELERTRTEHRERVSAVLVSHRGLIVATMRRLIEREIDRATRHRTTPEKFRSWIDAFYSTHVEVVTEELWPAVHAHLSVLSSSVDSHGMARQLAEEHVAESSKQLRDLLHVEDFHPMLERTIEQWRISRPEAVADRLLTKGLADVRS